MDTNEPKRHSKPKPRSRAAETREVDHLRRQRLARMVELAQSYLGCSKAQLALTLNRDPAKVVPDSGNPKLDMVMGLSDVLDWPAGDVAEALWLDPVDDATEQEPVPEKPFAELNRDAIAAHREGDHKRMRVIAAQMLRLAREPREHGIAANRMYMALDQAGRFAKALEFARMAASVQGLSVGAHLVYLANLANANYAMWNLNEAIALSQGVISEAAIVRESNDVVDLARGIAGYVSGSARRRLISELPERASVLGGDALIHLELATTTLRSLADRRNDSSFVAIANTCVGAAIEVEVLLGMRPPESAIQQLESGVSSIIDPSIHPRGDWLESWGWWAVFGLNLVLRYLGGNDRDRMAAFFSMKGHEIADRQENWAIRERVFTLEHSWHSVDQPQGGQKPCGDWTLDREDVRNLLGTMGRFPWFRQTGWRILSSARLL
ncbi:MAG: hypothetical protein KF724_12870 [Phycisphaeraceae bacterium]|nr:hypothetical protein [Phycisphaeraceae bacterium]